MPNGIARRLSEPDLILPALLVLNEVHGPVSTTQLSERLRNLLKPSGEDVEILAGRQDDKFSQKVRNLRSHKTLEAPGYATYESRGRQGYWRVTELGQRILAESSDFIRVALDPGFTSAVITQALSQLNYTNPNRVPRISVFDEDEAVKEGARSQAQRTVYERSRRLRDAAVEYYASQGALQCEVCGFSFERTYGDLGRGFIEIHHKKPIFCLYGQSIEQAIARAIRDVAALCANCHRMVHRKRTRFSRLKTCGRFWMEVGEHRRKHRVVERGVSPPRLVGQYDVIYADPPWTFQTYSVRGKGRGPEAHYDCMSLHDIKSLPVDCWASGTAALYLWCTVPHLQNALSVVEAWGFSYKSSFVWVKEKIGTGYWCRNRHELLLVGARGSRICPRFRGIPAADSVIEGQQRAHSQKPDKARQIIERYHPDANKLEMFARERVRGWDSWGLEVSTGIGRRRWKSNEPPNELPLVQ